MATGDLAKSRDISSYGIDQGLLKNQVSIIPADALIPC